MTHDFRVLISFDPDVAKWYVSHTELPGLILEDADPGRLLTRLRDAAGNLLRSQSGDHAADLGVDPFDTARIVPIYQPLDVPRVPNEPDLTVQDDSPIRVIDPQIEKRRKSATTTGRMAFAGLAALKRARMIAIKVAIDTDTGIAVVKEGKMVIVSAKELRENLDRWT